VLCLEHIDRVIDFTGAVSTGLTHGAKALQINSINIDPMQRYGDGGAPGFEPGNGGIKIRSTSPSRYGSPRHPPAKRKRRTLPTVLRVAPDRAVGTDPAQTGRPPAAGSDIASHPMELAPGAEVEVLPLVLLACGTKAPREIRLLVA
jgi:hypothetical protein